jgi:hypothetical protein
MVPSDMAETGLLATGRNVDIVMYDRIIFQFVARALASMGRQKHETK